ncbi:MAG TPA: DCC1-like thiol-disulfide oxidoreductase family protein [Acidobacteriaceae bacterium]|nr:DCC1-like thiol-disulfide oxidoreductase family protein [Acidobacteriaceae bacterium]
MARQQTLPCKDVVMYDGVCALCNGFVKFVLKHDAAGRFCFASLSSDYAQAAMQRHGAASVDSVGLLVNAGCPQETLLLRSDATIYVLRQMTRGWRLLARLLQIVPRRLRDSGYSLVARARYRIFGKYDVCPLPPANARSRFIAS